MKSQSNEIDPNFERLELLFTASRVLIHAYHGVRGSVDLDRDDPFSSLLTPEWMFYAVSLGDADARVSTIAASLDRSRRRRNPAELSQIIFAEQRRARCRRRRGGHFKR